MKSKLPGVGQYDLNFESMDSRSLRSSRRGKGTLDYSSLRARVETNVDFPGPGEHKLDNLSLKTKKGRVTKFGKSTRTSMADIKRMSCTSNASFIAYLNDNLSSTRRSQ